MANLDSLPNSDAGTEPVSRRGLMGQALPIAAAIAGLQWLPKIALGRGGPSDRDVLVVIFLRGGADGLTTLVPYGDPDLYVARPTLGIPPPGNPGGALDLDGFFGLHPSAAPLLQPYQAGQLAFVHATGSTDPTRSHFEAYQFMEFGIPNQPSTNAGNGWLARHLLGIDPMMSGSALRGVSVTSVMPFTLTGAPETLAITDLDNFKFVGGSTAEQRRELLTRSYAGTIEPIRSAAHDTFDTFDLLEAIDFQNYLPANGASYPDTPFGTGLKNSSALLKAGVGVEAMMLELGGWDLHANLLLKQPPLLDELSRALQAFYLDNLGGLDKITLVVMSEFGRRVAENYSDGLDHGHGNCMMVMGGHVAGGQVFRQWPGLNPSNLDSGDLKITIDYRDILSEILVKRVAEQKLPYVFPNYTPNFQ